MSQLNQFIRRIVQGQEVKVPVPQPTEHKNPPLTALNEADRKAMAERRAQMGEAAEIARKAVVGAFDARSGKRIQKPLRAGNW